MKVIVTFFAVTCLYVYIYIYIFFFFLGVVCFLAVPLVPIASAAARQAFSARFAALVKAVQKKPAPPPIPGCDNPEVRHRFKSDVVSRVM